jgi:hypothetical protein
MEDLNDTNRTADVALFMSWNFYLGRRATPSTCCKERAQ